MRRVRRYKGQENATVERVVRYLRTNYLSPEGEELSELVLLRLVVRNRREIADGIDMASFAYWPGNRIAETEGLVAK